MWIDDDILKRCQESMVLSCWAPSSPIVVLGSSNDSESEVHVELCRQDGVPILRRYGGGGTVVLHNSCLIVSLGAWVRQHFQNKFYFELLNASVIDALAKISPRFRDLSQDGLSDITLGDKKIAGTSLFRSRNYLLYQASILVDVGLELIDRYIKHPTREPDYRQGRRHHEFLMGLRDIEPNLTTELGLQILREHLDTSLKNKLGDELIEPQSAQFTALLARAERMS